MSPQPLEANDFEARLNQNASAVAGGDKDTLNSIRSPAQVDLDCLANQVRGTFLSSSQVMPSTKKEITGQEPDDSYEEHMQGLGTLRRLPGELRGLVFTFVVATGSMELMRVSKAVNREATPILRAKGICRLNIGFVATRVAWRYPAFYIAPGFANSIQNVTFTVNAAASPMRRSIRHHDALRLFAESRTRRKHCRVLFKCTYFLANLAVREVLWAVRRYTQFERVDIKLAIDGEQELNEMFMNEPSSDLTFQVDDKKMEVFGLVKNMLSPSLGKSGRFEEDGNTVVTFCPRKHGAVRLHENNAGTGSGVGLDMEANDEDEFGYGAEDDPEEFYEAYEDDYIQYHSSYGRVQDGCKMH